MVKIMHMSDVHLGAECYYLGLKKEERQAEIMLTFEKAIEVCNRDGIELLLIAGDLFESNSVSKEISDNVINKIASLENTKVVFAAGNHDPLTADSVFRLRDLPYNLYVLPTTDSCFTFTDIGVRVYGSSFGGVYKEGEPLFEISPPDDDFINIMVLHGDTSTTLDGNYNPITPKFISSSGMDYIALGHIHKRTDILKLGNTYFAYSGSLEGHGFDEPDEKGVYVGTVDKGKVNLDFMPLAKRSFRVFSKDITDCEDIEQAVLSSLQEFGKDYKDDLYKITLKGKSTISPAAVQKLASKINEQVYFAKISDGTSPIIDEEALMSENSLKGIFYRLIKEKIDSANDDEKEKYISAMELGLKSFEGEVKYDEN